MNKSGLICRSRFPQAFGVFVAVLLMDACSQTNQPPASSAPPGASAATSTSVVPTSTPVPSIPTFTAFAGRLPGSFTNTQCSLDIINATSAETAAPVTGGSTVTFGGWAGDGKGQAAANFVLVLKDSANVYSVPFATSIARPDVAAALKSTGMAYSGFNLSAATTGVHAGTYSIYIADPADADADCDTQRRFIVK